MQQAILDLVDYHEDKAAMLDVGAELKWARGTWGARVMTMKAAIHRNFAAELMRAVKGEPMMRDPKPKAGPGPYSGPCPACAGTKNSYQRMCSRCDAIDEDHFINAEDNVAVITRNCRSHPLVRTVDIGLVFNPA